MKLAPSFFKPNLRLKFDRGKILGFLVLLLGFSASAPRTKTTVRTDFKKYFEAYQVQGSFLLYDLQRDRYTAYNPARNEQGFIPASTFKIPNTLIGLETGVIPDPDFVIPWDGVERSVAAWNKDHSLRSAFGVSCLPYYQELARRVGVQRMQEYTAKLGFGNMVVTPERVDRFWLEGPSTISPKQEIDFLVRLYQHRLPVSERSVGLLQEMMILEKNAAYTLRGKTGWAILKEGRNVGWFVGYLEREGTPYFFATNVEAQNPDEAVFIRARRAITESILRDLKLL